MNSNKKGYYAYLAVVFLNAFVDLGHKIVIQNAIFKSYDGQQQVVLTAIVNGLILLPFILLFSPAGFLADRFAKHRVIRHSALVAVIATGLITFSYYQGWFWAAFALTLALAVQSAIYSPAKYGYIKELVGARNLASANGAVQAITIAGILLGTLVFSMAFEALLSGATAAGPGEIMHHIAPIGWVLVALALVEWLATALLPARRQGAPDNRFELKRYARLDYLRRNLKVLSERNAIWLSIIGLATFWAISQVMLAAFPAFAKESLGVTNTVVIQGVLACSGIGIVLGSMIAGRASRNYIETGFIPVGALGIAIGIAILPGLGGAVAMGLAFLFVGLMGGLFIVPLNSLIQFQARREQLGTVLAGNNWVQNVAMMTALALTVVFATVGIDSVGLFYILTGVAVIGTGYTVRKLPHSLARLLVMAILKRRYKVEVIGFDNLPQSGATLLLGNHISWIDWALVQIACPRPIRFVMLRRIYDTWYLKPLLKAFGVVPIAAGQSEEALRTINGLLKAGECVCLFPEGAISRNGHLGKFHTGYERTLEGVEDGVIVPFYLHGLWGSSLSRADEGLRVARAPDFRRDLIVAFGESLPLQTGAKALKQKVIELSLRAWQAYSEELETVPLAFLRTAKRRGAELACADASGESLGAAALAVAAARVAGGLPGRKPGRLGVLLPPGPDAAVAVLAALWRGYTVVPLDPARPDTWEPRARAAGIDRVLSTRAIAEAAESAGEALSGSQWLWLDELRATGSGWWRQWQFRLLPGSLFHRLLGGKASGGAPAVVLFDERERPVVLSHRNLMANCKQLSDVLNTRVDDVLLGSRAIDHPDGFVLGTVMPLVEGIPVVAQADRDDVLSLARAAARFEATLLPVMPGQLQALAAEPAAHPLMLASLRMVVCTGGPVAPALREAFELRFGRRVYEGLGGPATTALATLNIPDALDLKDWKVQQGDLPGSAGMPLPGTSLRIVDARTGTERPLGEEGELWIGGSQVMAGPADEDAGAVSTDDSGLRWLNTGLRARLNEEGFLLLADGQAGALASPEAAAQPEPA
ncbi:MFS transporter [Parahaliea mediterranea]|uniref:MFS transporter n=1 Tax=Parahaliea mediterranea TaxID=651086 RepID=A0A939DEV9_9GAMM|nr:MFS transporter [Parahaliea mediterranea]MBN7796601.1 MFS transporter [Parahaliea mediterranea]